MVFGDSKVKKRVASYQCYVETSEWNKPKCAKDATWEERKSCRSQGRSGASGIDDEDNR